MNETDGERDVWQGEEEGEGVEELGEGGPFPIVPKDTEVGGVSGVEVCVKKSVSVWRILLGLLLLLLRGGPSGHLGRQREESFIKTAEIKTQDSSFVMGVSDLRRAERRRKGPPRLGGLNVERCGGSAEGRG